MIDYKDHLLSVLKFLVIVLIALGMLKAVTYLPVKKIHPFLADKIIFVQKFEQQIESFFQDIWLTYREMALKRTTDRQYEVLYRELLAKKMLIEAILKDNNILRERLRFAQNYSSRLLPAEIISRSADTWFNFVLVNKGSAEGVQENMVAVNQDGLVGYAYEVSRHSSKVLMITDPQVQISCIDQRSGEIFILNGSLLRPLELKYATVHSDIQEGDFLLTSGYSYRYRKGIPIGTVTKVYLPRNKLYKRVEVKTLVNFSKLDVLFFLN